MMSEKAIFITKLVLILIGLLCFLIPFSIVLFTDKYFGEIQSHIILTSAFGCFLLSEAVSIIAALIKKTKVHMKSVCISIALVYVIVSSWLGL